MKLLRNFNAVACYILATAFFFAGCSKEQSSLSLDDITTKAKIAGRLHYSEGQTYEDGNFKEQVSVAAGKKVYIDVNNASLSGGYKGYGYTTFETISDENGKFEIEVPAVHNRYNSYGTEIIIRPEAFNGKVSTFYDIKDGVPTFKSKEAVFHARVSKQALPNDVVVANIKYGYTELEDDIEFKEYAPLHMKIGMGRFKVEKPYSYYEIIPYFTFSKGVNALIEVTYPNENDYYNPTKRTYGATTDENGEFILNIPVKQKNSKLDLIVTLLPVKEESFTYYYRYNSEINNQILYGSYRQYSNSYYYDERLNSPDRFNSVTFYADESSKTYLESRMVFVPDPSLQTSYRPTNYSWHNISFFENN